MKTQQKNNLCCCTSGYTYRAVHDLAPKLKADRDALLEAALLVLRGYERIKSEAPKQFEAMRSRSEYGWEDFGQGIYDLRTAVEQMEGK